MRVIATIGMTCAEINVRVNDGGEYVVQLGTTVVYLSPQEAALLTSDLTREVHWNSEDARHERILESQRRRHARGRAKARQHLDDEDESDGDDGNDEDDD